MLRCATILILLISTCCGYFATEVGAQTRIQERKSENKAAKKKKSGSKKSVKKPKKSASKPKAPIPSKEQQEILANADLEAEIRKFEESEEQDLDDEENADAPKPAPQPKTGALSGQIPFEFNKRVQMWINHFSKKDHERFQRYLNRGVPYRNVIEDILEENRVPPELFYLGLIESGFSLKAKSHASAVGVWQFMRPTGKMYGLEIAMPYVDERRDPIRATEAAARFLRDLFREFKSWYLALSAYNAGAGRVRQAIRRGQSRNYWVLVQRKALPQETIDYVPKFLAARWIGEHPDWYGFEIPEESYPDVELIKVPAPLKFADIEKIADMPEGTLAFTNPHLLKLQTRTQGDQDEIWVPEPFNKTIKEKYNDLLALRSTPFTEPKKVASLEKSVARSVTVRKGDTLAKIARRAGVSVSYLKKLNRLKSDQVNVGTRIKVAAEGYKKRRG